MNIIHRRFADIALLWFTVLGAVTTAGCITDHDFDRAEYQRGTLGEELFGIWHKDAKRAADKADQKTQMLERRQTEFVAAVDAIAPADALDEVDQFLQDVLALVDDGLVQGLTRKLQLVLDQAAQDSQLTAALAIQNRPSPQDFLSPVNGKNFIGHVMGYPRMAEVATRTTATLLEADGVDRRGQHTLSEPDALRDLVNAATVSLADTDLGDPTDTVAYSLQSVLATQDDRFSSPQSTSPLLAVRYDRRGLPKVRKTSSGLAAPFVDADTDGLADVNARGQWVLSTGDARKISAFDTQTDAQSLLNRDPFGRASSAGGEFSFQYIDLTKTGLHFLVRQIGELADDGLLWNLVDAAPSLLGDRQVKTDSRGQFSGYSADNPITDLAYAGLHMLDIPTLDAVLASLADFIDQSSPELAEVIFALDEAVEVFDDYPDAHMKDNQTVAYDLVPLLEKISADPDLWRDVFWALRQPISRHTGQPMATLLEYRDQNPSVPAMDGPYDTCFQSCKQQYPLFDSYDTDQPATCRQRYNPQTALQRYTCIRECYEDHGDEIFSEPMDFEAPESRQNRSMYQRLFHLLRDTAGQPYALEITEPDLASGLPPIVDLPGSAEAFLRSVGHSMDLADFVPDLGGLQPLVDLIGGNATLANILSTLSPVFGAGLSRRATPDEITRLFNLPQLSATVAGVDVSIASPMCKDGYTMANHHADILYAAEASGLIDTISPLACAFSKHDKENLMAQLFVIIHNHYSGHTDLYETANGDVSPMKGSNLRSLEPALLEILNKGTLFDALYDLSVAAERFKTNSGIDFLEQLRVLIQNATRSDDGFTGRDGQADMELADGRTIDQLSRLHILMQAAEQMDERVDGDPAAKEALEEMLSSLYDVFLATKWPDAQTHAQFGKPGSPALLAKVTRHLGERAKQERQAGNLSQWLTGQQMDNVVDIWNSRTLPAVVDLSQELAADRDNRDLTDGLVQYLVGKPAGQDQASMTLYTLLVYTLHQDTWVPLAHFLSDVIDPARSWQVQPYGQLPLVSHALQLLHDTVEQDPEGRGLDMLERGFSNRADGTIPLVQLIDIIADYFRIDPGSQQPFRAADYAQAFGKFGGWMGDDVHGMEQLYDVVGGAADQ